MMSEFDKIPGIEPPDSQELHQCPDPNCASDLVQLIDCEPIGFGDWCVTRHCPNCDWVGEGIYYEGDINHFEKVLDEGDRALIRSRDILAQANMYDMKEAADRFIKALHEGNIFPEDFKRT